MTRHTPPSGVTHPNNQQQNEPPLLDLPSVSACQQPVNGPANNNIPLPPLNIPNVLFQPVPANIPSTSTMANVEAIAHCKLPPFWKHCPNMWFIQIEAQFQCNRISSDVTRYNHLVGALDAETMLEVADVLRNPPNNNKYDFLKNAIIKRFTDSADRQLHKALTELELGEMKPSQLLRQMTSLAGDRATEDVLRVRWLALLPQPVQRCLKILRSSSLDEQASIADELADNGSGPFVMAAGHSFQRSVSPARNNSSEAGLIAVTRELSAIKLSLAELISCNRELMTQLQYNNNNNQHNSRSRSRSFSQSSSAHHSPAPSSICFYHRKYADNAKRCILPCSHPKKPVSEN